MLGRTGQVGADRVDSRSGLRERAAFLPFGTGDEQLFVASHEPVGEPIGSVLMCPSILADFLANYQREINLARSLASAGMAVVRFHYRGTGNSDGAPADMTLSSLRDDALWATDQLRSWLPDLPVAFVGTRWGALTAVSAAADTPAAPMVMCEPLIDFNRYYQDAMRSRAMSAMAVGKAKKAASLPELLAADGFADIVGNVIHQPLYDSTVGVDGALTLAEGGAHPALVVQFGGKELRAPLRKFELQLGDNGWDAESAVVDVSENWWFRTGRRSIAQDDFNDTTRTWLASRLQATTQQATGTPQSTGTPQEQTR